MSARLALGCAAALLIACGPGGGGTTDAGPTFGPDYESVDRIFAASCVFASCHGGAGMGSSRLNLMAASATGDFRSVLVDVDACQYDLMPLVDPGNPDNSWLMIKLAGDHMGAALVFTPDATWDPGIVRGGDGRYPSSVCPLTARGEITFGTIMPQGSTTGLPAAQLEAIRGWIAAGAPGPSGS